MPRELSERLESEINTRDNESRTEQNEDNAVTKTSAISKSKKKKNTTTKQTPLSTPDVLQTETKIQKTVAIS